MRFVRLIRLVKLMHAFQSLYLVDVGIYDAMETTLIVTLVLVVVVYVFALFCVSFISKSDERFNYPGFTLNEDENELIENFNPYMAFGSMDRAMLTLFNIVIMAEWPEVIRPMNLKQPALIIPFAAFMWFLSFGLMNVFIGMVVDSVNGRVEKVKRGEI